MTRRAFLALLLSACGTTTAKKKRPRPPNPPGAPNPRPPEEPQTAPRDTYRAAP